MKSTKSTERSVKSRLALHILVLAILTSFASRSFAEGEMWTGDGLLQICRDGQREPLDLTALTNFSVCTGFIAGAIAVSKDLGVYCLPANWKIEQATKDVVQYLEQTPLRGIDSGLMLLAALQESFPCSE